MPDTVRSATLATYAAARYPETQMAHLDRITINPDQCSGRPCIRGLRIRVKDILDLLACGATPEDVLADYPYLQREDISAALEYAAQQADHAILRIA